MFVKNCSLLGTAVALIINSHAFAQDSDTSHPQEILVFGSDFNLQGTPVSATEGTVFQKQLELRPISRTAELLEFVPGLIATQHSGEGKANQYFVRGFNLDHGTDFAIKLDHMPVNMPSHGHGQGYADINFVIPELVYRMTYRKGPYYANGGDFATAGEAEFSYADRLEQGQANLTLGENGYQRVFAGQSFELGDGALTLAGALTRYNGPWDMDQDLDKRKTLVKYHQQDEDVSWSITGMSYDNSWDSTDQIPLRAVEDGSLSRWGNIDPTAGGESRRNSLSFDWHQTLSAQSDWRFNAYGIDYAMDLYSNFTYFAVDPVRGDQFQQTDSRRIAGLDSEYHRQLNGFSIPTELRLGVQHRYDDIHVGLHLTEQRQRYDSVRDDYVQQSLSSTYAALEQQWTDRIRTESSLRVDHYRFDVTDLLGQNSGKGNDTLLSPKFNLIYAPVDGVETFVSAGRGFHSNDARGATIVQDPASGDPADTVDPLARARSFEVGMRTSLLPKTQLAVSAFSMRLSSELIYVGDAGATEASDASQREGVEINSLYTPTNWLLFDAAATWTKARLRGVDENRIPNAVRDTASLGMIINDLDGWSGGIRARYLGKAPLIESGEVFSDSTVLLNGQVTYAFTPSVSLSVELLNMLDSKDRDITYFYESQLQGEVAPVEDIHFHPVEPRSLRVSLTARF
ncbi:MAG: TonB-dependent receptor [Pseudohongiella sp.]|nr:TonB-dependent receptor [Pseudohongiella sp.]MDP2125928.1 TonB-dependent receptor [Pseudohongiella sp.]